jgi:hypothetical protein
MILRARQQIPRSRRSSSKTGSSRSLRRVDETAPPRRYAGGGVAGVGVEPGTVDTFDTCEGRRKLGLVSAEGRNPHLRHGE